MKYHGTDIEARPTYREIPQAQVPAGVRFDVTRRNAGQMVEVAFGGFSRSEHDYGDQYKRITDRQSRTTRYFVIVKEAA